jgi:RNA polymerase sigma-70 factor, ECF subfamily
VTDAAVNQSESDGPTSLSLLQRVQARDRAAWERLVSLYGPMVYRWCLRAGLQSADAADVGQEVFAAVACGIDRFRHDRKGDTFRGWLYAITRNKIRDRSVPLGATGAGGSDAQQRLAKLPAERSDEPGSSTDAEEANEEKALCRRAIALVRDEFKAHTWEAFWRAFVDGHAPADIAADLGVAVNVVYLAKSRVLRRLREEYAVLVDFHTTGAW